MTTPVRSETEWDCRYHRARSQRTPWGLWRGVSKHEHLEVLLTGKKCSAEIPLLTATSVHLKGLASGFIWNAAELLGCVAVNRNLIVQAFLLRHTSTLSLALSLSLPLSLFLFLLYWSIALSVAPLLIFHNQSLCLVFVSYRYMSSIFTSISLSSCTTCLFLDLVVASLPSSLHCLHRSLPRLPTSSLGGLNSPLKTGNNKRAHTLRSGPIDPSSAAPGPPDARMAACHPRAASCGPVSSEPSERGG